MQPRGSKAKRAAARRRVPPNHRSEFLKARSVTDVAARRYRSCSDAFLRWAKVHRRSTAHFDRLDATMADYCTALYFDGALPFEGRQALYGYAFCFDLAFKGCVNVVDKAELKKVKDASL